MRKGNFIQLALALTLVACCPAASGGERQPYRSDRLLIVPKSGADGDLQQLRHKRGHQMMRRFQDLGVDLVELPPGSDPAQSARAYMESGLVEFAEPDYRLRIATVPDDPGYTRCWGLNNTGQSGGKANSDIGAEVAWATRTSAEDTIVAVIDSGVRYTHEDLAANMWQNPRELPNGKDDDRNGFIDDIHGIDAFLDTGDPWDDLGHGTHVAGTIGAVGNNGKGVAGVCWNVKLMALRFMDAEGWGDTSDAIACIDYARRNGAKVINASWGGPDNSFALRTALNAARRAGIIVVVAAGNELSNNDTVRTYPASYSLDNIVTVAAINRYGTFESAYSNYGKASVDLAAPGSEIYSTSYFGDGKYETLTGTSMAAPHVTGAIALLLAAYPQDDHTAIIARLLAGVEKLPSLEGKCATGGTLNLAKLFPRPASTAQFPGMISGISLSSSGSLRLAVADLSQGFLLETSTNLADWTSVPEYSVAGSSIQISPTPGGTRFFRVRRP